MSLKPAAATAALYLVATTHSVALSGGPAEERGTPAVEPAGHACLSAGERERIEAAVRADLDRLERSGRLPGASPGAPARTLHRLPLRAAEHLHDPGFYYVLSYVDHALDSSVLDYNCGRRTHNGPSGAHNGIDYNIWPFTWNKMDSNDVEVVASADGTVIFRAEGNEDRSCPGAIVGPDENGLIVRHADRSLSYYFHTKRGTLTSKQVGEPILAGEYIGVVGSSGASISPHLHYELRTGSGRVIDPYAGPCNDYNAESWWEEQPPYVDPAVLKVSTHSGRVAWSSCPDPDITFVEDAFQPGQYILYYVFGRDVSPEDLFEFAVYGPDGDLVRSWNVSWPNPYARNYYFSRLEIISQAAEHGTYVYEVRSHGETHRFPYKVGTVTPVEFASLEARISGEGVELRWEIVTAERLRGIRVYRRGSGSEESDVLHDGYLSPWRRSFLDRTAAPGAVYRYEIGASRPDGSEILSGDIEVRVPGPGIRLAQNVPNPFHSGTTIRFLLGSGGNVRIDVFDAMGKSVRRLVDRGFPPGDHRITWDVRNEAGARVSAGRYFYRLSTGEQVLSRSMLVLR